MQCLPVSCLVQQSEVLQDSTNGAVLAHCNGHAAHRRGFEPPHRAENAGRSLGAGEGLERRGPKSRGEGGKFRAKKPLPRSLSQKHSRCHGRISDPSTIYFESSLKSKTSTHRRLSRRRRRCRLSRCPRVCQFRDRSARLVVFVAFTDVVVMVVLLVLVAGQQLQCSKCCCIKSRPWLLQDEKICLFISLNRFLGLPLLDDFVDLSRVKSSTLIRSFRLWEIPAD